MSTLVPCGEHHGPQPVVHPETEEHWRGLGRGELLLQECTSCGRVRFPLAPVCWECLGDGFSWVPVASEGVVRTAVTVHRATGQQVWADVVPFVAAWVETTDGHRLTGRVVDADQAPAPGTPVRGGTLSAEDGYGVLCFILDPKETP